MDSNLTGVENEAMSNVVYPFSLNQYSLPIVRSRLLAPMRFAHDNALATLDVDDRRIQLE